MVVVVVVVVVLVVVVVPVVVVARDVVVGRGADAAACAGTTIDSTIGRVQRAGRINVTRPALPNVCRAFLRLGCR